MADVFTDGNTRAAYVASISNIAQPTVAELNAGILLQDTIAADGLEGFEVTNAAVETTPLSGTVDTAYPGRDAYSGMLLRFKKQGGTDTIFNTLTKGTAGYVAIRRGVASTTAWTAGQAVEVYAVICGREKRLKPLGNQSATEKYEIPLFTGGSCNQRATVAA